MKPKQVCKVCGKVFYKFNSQTKGFCSRACANRRRCNQKLFSCEVCKRTFSVRASIAEDSVIRQGKRYKTRRRYCSRQCYRLKEFKTFTFTCKQCGKDWGSRIGWPKKFCSHECSAKYHVGMRNGFYSNNPGYSAVHRWLSSKYGKANECWSKKCPGTSRKYEWAKRHNGKYIRDVSQFMKLCQSCHRRYDLAYNKYKHLIE